jgi:hypothetical protein
MHQVCVERHNLKTTTPDCFLKNTIAYFCDGMLNLILICSVVSVARLSHSIK